MKALCLKRIQKTGIFAPERDAFLFGSLSGPPAGAGAWLCRIQRVCISHQVLAKLQPSEKEEKKTKKRHEDDSQVEMSVLSSCLLLSAASAERYEMDPLI